MWRCGACGEEWETNPLIVAPCPTCGAEAGSPCKRPSGHSGRFVETHVAREQAALDAGLLAMCPAGPSAKEQPVQGGLGI